MTGFTPVDADGQTNVSWLTGWQFTENAADPGAPARVLLRAAAPNGRILADIRLAAGQSAGDSFDEPIDVDGGVFVDVALGDIRGALYGG